MAMKYGIEQDAKMMNRVLRYTTGDAILPALVVIVLSGTLVYSYNPILAAAILGTVCTFLLFYVLYLVFYPGYMRRNYGDNEGRVIWTYDISKSNIVISIAEKAHLTYEKEAVKFCKVYRHGVLFKHKRSAFILFLPEGREPEVARLLDDYGWLKKRRSVYREVIVLFLWMLFVIGAVIASVVLD